MTELKITINKNGKETHKDVNPFELNDLLREIIDSLQDEKAEEAPQRSCDCGGKGHCHCEEDSTDNPDSKDMSLEDLPGTSLEDRVCALEDYQDCLIEDVNYLKKKVRSLNEENLDLKVKIKDLWDELEVLRNTFLGDDDDLCSNDPEEEDEGEEDPYEE